MRAKSMVLILIALGCGLVASIAISQVMERNGSGDGVETVQIYVATSDIDINDQLTADNVRVEDWPTNKVPEGAIINFEDVGDHFARVRFYEGEPILTAKLANEIEGPAINIPEGHRVCSLKVQMDTAVSGLVNPGDRVDIFGYFREGRDIPKTGTREILHNVRVFAVNSETEQETDQEGRTIVAKTVSVLVQQEQVAKLMLATELGTLRLALRRPNESAEPSSGETATIETLFGTRSESADNDGPAIEPQGPQQLASAAGGFVSFLNRLKSGGPPAGLGNPMAGMMNQPPAGPAWQMVILTPDGGQEFTWDDENGLPNEGGMGGMGGVPAPPVTTVVPPTTGVGVPGMPGAGGLPPASPEPVQEEPNQEEEENNQGMDDD